MQQSKLARLALGGLVGTMMTGMTFTQEAQADGHNHTEKKQDQKSDYKEVHDCAGLNVCRGLGGCKVTEAKLEKLAKKRGIDPDRAGEAHACAGLNECRGLGGCGVTAEKYVKLQKKQVDKNAKYGTLYDVHTCAGLNTCKGLGGCKVTETKLKKLAKKRGIAFHDAGEAHGCAGLNECKGLGGCKVTYPKFKKLKKKMAAK